MARAIGGWFCLALLAAGPAAGAAESSSLRREVVIRVTEPLKDGAIVAVVSCPVFKSFIQGCGAQFGWDAASCRVRDPYGIITARPKSYVWSGNPKVGCSGDGPDGDPRGNPPGVACAEGYRLEVLHAFEWPGITGAGFNLSACVSESEPAAR